MKKRHFKVKIGFGKGDFISISEDELALALRAQINGKIAVFRGGTVAGNNIIAITPDYNKALGYNPFYELEGEDYTRLGEDEINAHRDLIEAKKTEVYQSNGQISSPQFLKLK